MTQIHGALTWPGYHEKMRSNLFAHTEQMAHSAWPRGLIIACTSKHISFLQSVSKIPDLFTYILNFISLHRGAATACIWLPNAHKEDCPKQRHQPLWRILVKILLNAARQNYVHCKDPSNHVLQHFRKIRLLVKMIFCEPCWNYIWSGAINLFTREAQRSLQAGRNVNSRKAFYTKFSIALETVWRNCEHMVY